MFLPVMWAIVATAIGVILYKSSDAFFEQVNTGKGTKRQLKLAGSITIAAVAFYGMYYVTPRAALEPRPDGMRYYSKAAIDNLAGQNHEIQNKLILLAACLAV